MGHSLNVRQPTYRKDLVLLAATERPAFRSVQWQQAALIDCIRRRCQDQNVTRPNRTDVRLWHKADIGRAILLRPGPSGALGLPGDSQTKIVQGEKIKKLNSRSGSTMPASNRTAA
jgi:hypothetical protein